jgi:hypothetical protein
MSNLMRCLVFLALVLVPVTTGNCADLFSLPVKYSLGSYQAPKACCLADVDNDGDIDLLITRWWSDQVGVYMNDGLGAFTLSANYSVGDNPYSVIAADFGTDGYSDLVAGQGNGSGIALRKNSGSGTFPTYTPVSAKGSTESVVAGDFDGDGDLDIAASLWAAAKVSVLKGNGSDTITWFDTIVVGSGPGIIKAADLDGDSDSDLVVVCGTAGNAYLLFNSGQGVFSPGASPLPCGSFPDAVALADFDSDGDVDIAISPTSSLALLFSNDGSGNFTTTDSLQTGSGVECMFAADLDLDGKMDLAAARNTGVDSKLAFIKGDGNGQFDLPVQYSTDSNSVFVDGADLDGDRDVDLAVVNMGSSSFSILFNQYDEICCQGTTGNCDGDPMDLVDISDLSAMIDYLVFNVTDALSPCFRENDVDNSGSIDISDLAALVDFLNFSIPLPSCP